MKNINSKRKEFSLETGEGELIKYPDQVANEFNSFL